MELPVYIPNPMVCHMEMYHCCKQYSDCRLHSVCSQIRQQSVCKKDCPSCSYQGCSLPVERRKSQPVYLAGLITADRVDLDLVGRYEREHTIHRVTHKKRYAFYNWLFGDIRERNRQRSREYYYRNRELLRAARQAKKAVNEINGDVKLPDAAFLPECGLKCSECSKSECDLPEDWREKSLNRQRNRKYYYAHQDEVLEKQRMIRQRPEVKVYRAEYNRKYQQNNREKTIEKSRRWRTQHPERFAESQRKYREANREKINARRREKRRLQRELSLNATYAQQ